jgi:hypothetical protein
MKTKPFLRHLMFLILLILLSGCSQDLVTPANASAATATPDLCTSEKLPAEVEKINGIMQEFDNAAVVAAKAPREKLTAPIAELQRIRRNAEDQSTPACLTRLKETQLAHMNVVIETMMAFMDGAEQNAVNQGVALARQLHNQYLVEMAKITGMTVAPLNSPAP